MELTNEELKAKLTEGATLLKTWERLWQRLAGPAQEGRDGYDPEHAPPPEFEIVENQFTLCSTETRAYIQSLESE